MLELKYSHALCQIKLSEMHVAMVTMVVMVSAYHSIQVSQSNFKACSLINGFQIVDT